VTARVRDQAADGELLGRSVEDVDELGDAVRGPVIRLRFILLRKRVHMRVPRSRHEVALELNGAVQMQTELVPTEVLLREFTRIWLRPAVL
jgi:hypothetical protein